MDKLTELKPCPFCGEPAERDLARTFHDYHGNPGRAVSVYCSGDCLAEMTACLDDFPEHTPEELLEFVISRWNQRVDHEKI